MGWFELEDDVAELTRWTHTKCRTQQSRYAESLVAQPSWSDGLYAMVHVALELHANVAQCLAKRIVFAGRNTEFEYDVVRIGATDERWSTKCFA